jgi:hypothetical protein
LRRRWSVYAARKGNTPLVSIGPSVGHHSDLSGVTPTTVRATCLASRGTSMMCMGWSTRAGSKTHVVSLNLLPT